MPFAYLPDRRRNKSERFIKFKRIYADRSSHLPGHLSCFITRTGRFNDNEHKKHRIRRTPDRGGHICPGQIRGIEGNELGKYPFKSNKC